MSNILLRTLREAGLMHDWALPFARAKAAADAARRHNERDPNSRAVMIVDDAGNTGTYWLVSEADAQRLETKGYVRYIAKPETEGDPADGELQ